MWLRLIFACVAFAGLSSCSYVYDVHALVRNGELFFVSDKDWFRERCVRTVEVVAEDREAAATSARGDDEARVGYGTYWRDEVGYDCETRFPIRYGSKLEGRVPEEARRHGTVAAKSLVRGVVYGITTTSGATGYGGGRFMLREDGTVRNLR